MSERFIFHKTKSGVQLHNGDEAMTELEAEKMLNDLWNTCKEKEAKIAETEAKYQDSCLKWRAAFDAMHRRAMKADAKVMKLESESLKDLMP